MNNYSSQWYQQLLQQSVPPPIYPPYGLPIPLPENMYNQAFPGLAGLPAFYPNMFPPGVPLDPAYFQTIPPNTQGVMKSMMPTPASLQLHHNNFLSLQEAQRLDPNLKIKIDQKKLGSYGNSYLDKLKPPKIVEIDHETFVKSTPPHARDLNIPIIPPKPLKKKANLVKPKNTLASKSMPKFAKTDPKTQQMLRKPTENQAKNYNSLIHNDIDPYYSLLDSKDSEVPSSFSNKSNIKFTQAINDSSLDQYSNSKNLSMEKQIDINRNLIMMNRQQIDDFNFNINGNQREKISPESYRLESGSVRSYSPLYSEGRNDQHVSLKPLNNTNMTKYSKISPRLENPVLENPVDFVQSTEFQIGRTRFKKVSPPRRYLSKPPPDDFIKSNNHLDYTKKGYGSNEPPAKKQERLGKQKEFAELLRLRNKKIGKSNKRSTENSIQNSTTNSTTDMMISESNNLVDSKSTFQSKSVTMEGVKNSNNKQANGPKDKGTYIMSKEISDEQRKNSNLSKQVDESKTQIQNTNILPKENFNNQKKLRSQTDNKIPKAESKIPSKLPPFTSFR